jgi:hypothetical protein
MLTTFQQNRQVKIYILFVGLRCSINKIYSNLWTERERERERERDVGIYIKNKKNVIYNTYKEFVRPPNT